MFCCVLAGSCLKRPFGFAHQHTCRPCLAEEVQVLCRNQSRHDGPLGCSWQGLRLEQQLWPQPFIDKVDAVIDKTDTFIDKTHTFVDKIDKGVSMSMHAGFKRLGAP